MLRLAPEFFNTVKQTAEHARQHRQECRRLHAKVVRHVLLVEALLHLVLARIALGLLPFHLYECLIRTDDTPMLGAYGMTARAVGSAVQRIAGIVPCRSDCLIQATAAQWMLRRRKVPTRLHVGVVSANSAVNAHAWLVYDSFVITGRRGHKQFHTLRVY